MSQLPFFVPDEITEDEFVTNPKYRAVFALMRLLEHEDLTREQRFEFGFVFAMEFDQLEVDTLRAAYRYVHTPQGRALSDSMWQEFEAYQKAQKSEAKEEIPPVAPIALVTTAFLETIAHYRKSPQLCASFTAHVLEELLTRIEQDIANAQDQQQKEQANENPPA